jgi:pilus assembly protein CpaE
MREAFTSAHAMLNAPKHVEAAADRPHCAVAVIGTRGGVGASTLATSLAWLLSEKNARSTALLDLDVHFGTGALALDLEPGRGLTDAIENPSRIDGLFIERAMVRASERLAVLSAEAPIHSPIVTDGSAFFQLQEEMRGAFECTVIDLPRGMLVQHPHLVADVQTAVLVAEFTLAAARDAIRILSWFKSNAPQTRVIVVANRVQPAAQLEISRKDFEGSIERKVDFVIPYDAKLTAQAAKLGKPIADAGKGSKTIAPLVELVEDILDATDHAQGGDGPKPGKATVMGGSLLGKLSGLTAKLPGKSSKK